MIIALGLLTALALPADTVRAGSADAVAYAVAPVMAGGALSALAVEIRFAGDADGETRLQLPSEWAGSEELWRSLTDLEVEGAAVREEGPEARVLAHRPGAPIVVRYRVRSAYEGEPGFGYEKARPLVLPDWFFFHGEGVFATVGGRDEAPASFTWRDFPAGWRLASDLDHLADVRRGRVRDVVESVALGAPDLSVVRREVDGVPLRIALRGSWEFTAEAFAEVVERIVTGADRLWGDPARPFLVTLAPLGGEGAGLSSTGTGRSDAFSVASTSGFALEGARRFLAHEYLHTWIPVELGGGFERDEPLGYWFSEGFTDYLASRLLLEAGLWSFEEYLDELNRTLLRYAGSPARAATAHDIRERFWTDRDVQQLPYDRGHLLAHLLEHDIRRATAGRAGLLEVLLAQRARARRNAAAGERVAGPALFAEVLREEAGIDPGTYLARHVEAGEAILLPAELFGGCASVVTGTRPEFDRGFDVAATTAAGGILSGVDPSGPAYAAGMRDGMRLIRREAGATNDSRVEIAYRVVDEQGERVIRYLPEGAGRITLQRVHPAADRLAQDCLRR